MRQVHALVQFGRRRVAVGEHDSGRQQCIDHGGIARLFEEGRDRTRHFAADVRQRLQQHRRGAAHGVERAKPVRQRLGRGVAQMRNAKREKEARQRGLAAGVDAGDQVFRPARGEIAARFDPQVLAKETGLPPLRIISGTIGPVIGEGFEHRLCFLRDPQGALGLAHRQQQFGRRGAVQCQLHPDQIGDIQRVKIGRGMHEAELDQRLGLALAQSFDIHRAARGEVPHGFLALCRAGQPAAATPGHGALFLHQFRGADGALSRHPPRPCIGRAVFGNHAHDFGNHIAGPAHDHAVAFAHIQPRDLVGVVQGGVGDSDAGDLHRLQPRHRCDRAGAADLHFDGAQHGGLLLGRELVRDGPARCTRNKTHGLLLGVIVQFVDHAVDVVRQGITLRADLAVIGDQAVDTTRCIGFRCDRQAEFAQ